MARAVVEEALWDLEAQVRGLPVCELYAGDRSSRDRIPVGISIGIKEEFEELADFIAKALAQGYQRIKLKIGPGKDAAVVEKVREKFGDIPCDGRRQLRLLARAGRGAASVGSLRAADDRATAGARRPVRSCRAAVRARDTRLSRREHPYAHAREAWLGFGGVPIDQHQGGETGRANRGHPGSRPVCRARRAGLVRKGCWSRASVGCTTSLWPRCRTSRYPGTFRRHGATGTRTSSTRPSRSTPTARSRYRPRRASVIGCARTGCNSAPCGLARYGPDWQGE